MRFERASGVLLHPTSLPGPHGSGDFGPAAYHFIDWLVSAGQTLWQILPLGGIGAGNSPYMSSSAFAGNVLLIDLNELLTRGWLRADELLPASVGSSTHRIDFASMVPFRMSRLRLAAQRFFAHAGVEERADLARFCQHHADWQADHALFMALAEHHHWQDWQHWSPALARRDAAALEDAAARHAEAVDFWSFCQWCFFRQWQALRAYAHRQGVKVIGDAPIFIALQSAEVWARQDLFLLEADGTPSVVAGVPPDFFSATGQRWGNPLYRWPAHAGENFAWWIQRIRRTFELVDIVRIDHFRGFAGYWEIPSREPTAVHGHWRPGPGAPLFKAIAAALGPLPIIAEDLGVVTPDVVALRKQFAFPGMRILHFAFGGDSSNSYLPHNHDVDTVAYAGTHDNNTSVGWWAEASEAERSHVRRYLNVDGGDIAWDLIRATAASVADTAVHTLQDVLGLGGEHRMNLPGQGQGYWEWRFSWDQVAPRHAQRLLELTRLYGRAPEA